MKTRINHWYEPPPLFFFALKIHFYTFARFRQVCEGKAKNVANTEFTSSCWVTFCTGHFSQMHDNREKARKLIWLKRSINRFELHLGGQGEGIFPSHVPILEISLDSHWRTEQRGREGPQAVILPNPLFKPLRASVSTVLSFFSTTMLPEIHSSSFYSQGNTVDFVYLFTSAI